MKFWGLGARRREEPSSAEGMKGRFKGGREAPEWISPSLLHLSCPRGAAVLPGTCNAPCITGTNERCSELEVKGEILAKSCLQEIPCRALAECPRLGVWTRAGLTHTVCCSWLIPARSNNALSHQSHRQGNCRIYRVNTWLQIHWASRKEEEEEELH